MPGNVSAHLVGKVLEPLKRCAGMIVPTQRKRGAQGELDGFPRGEQ